MKKRLCIAFMLTVCLAVMNLGGCGIRKNEMSEGGNVTSDTAMEGCGLSEMQTEEYSAVTENGFVQSALQPLSTFSADVDSASYSNVRRMLGQGRAPEEIPEGAVRLEEMVNYFNYEYPQPQEGEIFGISIDGADCPWQADHGLLRIGIRTRDIDFSDSPKSNLVFLLDVSGSMDEPDKLPLLKQAFAMLVDNLGEKDRISIVTYAGADMVILEGARGDEKGEILEALNYLEAGGGTNGSAGIETAYALAEANFIEGGNNRIILATDGDLNIGETSESQLQSLVEKKREGGVYLSVLGFGSGNLKDNKLEALADNGNGNYAYIDSLMEAKRVLVDELGSTLVTVAEDVKLQVEFNPAWIQEYRLLGYENRLLNPEDFTDDTKDAGEIGAGHTVTVLYEVVWAGESQEDGIDLRYQTREPVLGETMKEWATLKIRYKAPGASDSQEIVRAFGAEIYRQDILEANMLLEASAAEFAMLLCDSEWKGNSSYEHLLSLWSNVSYGGSKEAAEFLELVKLAADLTQAGTADETGTGQNEITLQAIEGTTAEGGSFLLANPFTEIYYYGEKYSLEKEEEGSWIKLKQKDGVGWHEIAYLLEPETELQLDINWEWAYGTLPPGTYRMQKRLFSESGTEGKEGITVTAEFTVADNGGDGI